MRIHKIGHCCLVIEKEGTRIMTDPGRFSSAHTEITDLDGILITHKHVDHLDPETIRTVVANNPDARIITNDDVGGVLSEQGIAYETAKEEEMEISGISIRPHPAEHAFIYPGMELPENTGYFIADALYTPGDSLVIPPFSVPLLAAPFGAPWGRIQDFIDYVKEVAPTRAFPIHDGMLAIYGPFHALPGQFLPEAGITFTALESGADLTWENTNA